MIKYFCDKCGKEIESGNLCPQCQEGDLTCGFKVGDVVITDDGRTGFIERFCTCDKCKSRGFYEPKIAIEKYADPIYISNYDKQNGFVSFYRIGSRVFGNVDHDAIIRIEQFVSTTKGTIKELRAKIKKYKKQLKVVKALEAKQRKGRKRRKKERNK